MEIIDIFKQFGFAGIVAIIAWMSFRYILKSAQQKNNIIANHISENTKVLEKLQISINDLHDCILKILEKL